MKEKEWLFIVLSTAGIAPIGKRMDVVSWEFLPLMNVMILPFSGIPMKSSGIGKRWKCWNKFPARARVTGKYFLKLFCPKVLTNS